MTLRFTLEDGSTVSVENADADALYDLLWLLVPRPGAVSAAARVRHAQMGLPEWREALTGSESSALIAALDRLH